LYDLFVTCEDLPGWDSVASLALVSGSSDASTEPGRELRTLASRFASDAAALQALDEAGDEILTRLEKRHQKWPKPFAHTSTGMAIGRPP
jgi:hypothetical protein